MIRWYDYPIAFLAADFMWANLQTALFGGLFWAPIGALGAYFIWKLWEDTYIPWRVGQEFDTN